MEESRQDISKGLNLIQELAIQLRVSKECLATSNFYFRTFKALCLEKRNSYYLVGACVFLASKAVEQLRHSETLCRKLYQIRMSRKAKVTPNLQIPPLSASMLSSLKHNIFCYEFLLLDELGFNTRVPLPYKKIQVYVESLQIPPQLKNGFLRLAFGFANDFYKTSIPLVKEVSKISEACVFLAAKRFKLEVGFMPDDEIIGVLKIAVKIECNNKSF